MASFLAHVREEHIELNTQFMGPKDYRKLKRIVNTNVNFPTFCVVQHCNGFQTQSSAYNLLVFINVFTQRKRLTVENCMAGLHPLVI